MVVTGLEGSFIFIFAKNFQLCKKKILKLRGTLSYIWKNLKLVKKDFADCKNWTSQIGHSRLKKAEIPSLEIQFQ